MAGTTSSANFPTTSGVVQATKGSGSDGFVLKINPTITGTGQLVYSTFLGGNGNDQIHALARDSSGNIYVAGYTTSTSGIATTGAYQTSRRGRSDAFVTKLNASFSSKLYATYLGGSGTGQDDEAYGIAVDSSGNAFVTGHTETGDFPTTSGSYQTNCNGNDPFVSKINSSGSGLVYSTCVSGSSEGHPTAIAIDSSGNAYVTGETYGAGFPTTPGAYQLSNGGTNEDAFVFKLNAAGSGLVFSTYLGGNDADWGNGIALDSSGNLYVVGNTYSTNLPVTTGAYQSTNAGQTDLFLARLNPSGSGLLYLTYMGGAGYDGGYGVAVDAIGNAYVTGAADVNLGEWPTTPGAYQTAGVGGLADAIVAKFAMVNLVFTTQPGGAVAGGLLTPQPVVKALAPDGSVITSFNQPITLSIMPGTGTASAFITGTTTVNAVNGIATFTNIGVNLPGQGYKFLAKSGIIDTGISASRNIAVAGTTAITTPGYFHTITPFRFYDTRTNLPNPLPPLNGEGTIGPSANCSVNTPGKEYRSVSIKDANNVSYIPNVPTNAAALLTNITVANAECGGNIGIYPGSVPPEGLNETAVGNWYRTGARTVGNYSVINLDSAGQFVIKGESNRTDVIIDVFGYIDIDNSTTNNGGLYFSISNSTYRLYDSRSAGSNNPNPPLGVGSGPLKKGDLVRDIQVTGNLNIPTNNVTAVVVNLTANSTMGGGYFTLYPTNAVPDNVASVNWNDRTADPVNLPDIPGDVGNLAVVPLDSNGKMYIKAGGTDSSSGADVIIDVVGYIQTPSNPPPNGGRYSALSTPTRLYDTRSGTPDYPGSSLKTNLQGEQSRVIKAAGTPGIPPYAKSIVVRVTITDEEKINGQGNGGGFLALYRGPNWPGNASVNVTGLNQTIGNLAIVELNDSGSFMVRAGNPTSKFNFTLDVFGYLPIPPDCTTVNGSSASISTFGSPEIATNQVSGPTPNKIGERVDRQQSNLVSSGSIAVWEDRAKLDLSKKPTSNSNKAETTDILGFDFSTNQPIAVTTKQGYHDHPAISGSVVVWEERKANCNICDGDIIGKDLKTGAEYTIASGPADQSFPAIEGNTVTWLERTANGRQLVFATLGSKTTETIVAVLSNDDISQPVISPELIVWKELKYNKNTLSQVIIRAFDRKSGKILDIDKSGFGSTEIAVKGQRVVWTTFTSLEFADLSTGKRITLETGATKAPSIEGDTILWSDLSTTDEYHITAVDLKSPNQKKQLAAFEKGRQSKPQIIANNLVWQRDEAAIASLPLSQALTDKSVKPNSVKSYATKPQLSTLATTAGGYQQQKGINTANGFWNAATSKALLDEVSVGNCPAFGSYVVLSTQLDDNTGLANPLDKVGKLMSYLQARGARVIVRLRAPDSSRNTVELPGPGHTLSTDATVSLITGLFADYPWIKEIQVDNEPNVEWTNDCYRTNPNTGAVTGCEFSYDRPYSSSVTYFWGQGAETDASSGKYMAISFFYRSVLDMVNYYKTNYPDADVRARLSAQDFNLWAPPMADISIDTILNIYDPHLKSMVLAYGKMPYHPYIALNKKPNSPPGLQPGIFNPSWEFSFPQWLKDAINGQGGVTIRSAITEFGWQPQQIDSDPTHCNLTHDSVWPADTTPNNDSQCGAKDRQNHTFVGDINNFITGPHLHNAELVTVWIVRLGQYKINGVLNDKARGNGIDDTGKILDWLLNYQQLNP